MKFLSGKSMGEDLVLEVKNHMKVQSKHQMAC